jgi:biotin transport system substrate-specific component
MSKSVDQVSDYERALALRSALLKVWGLALFVVLTAAAARAKITLPLTPVPITLQPMAVLLAGVVLGPRLGGLSQLVYVLAGLCGLQVFAGAPGAGPAVLAGPTGGYLMSYPAAAFLAGRLAIGSNSLPKTAAAMLAGLLIIYACGAVWLAFILKVGLARALQVGVYPFVVPDLLKIAIASVAATISKAALRQGASGIWQ